MAPIMGFEPDNLLLTGEHNPLQIIADASQEAIKKLVSDGDASMALAILENLTKWYDGGDI